MLDDSCRVIWGIISMIFYFNLQNVHAAHVISSSQY